MKKFILMLLLVLLIASPAFAAVGIQYAGSQECTATDINFSSGTSVTCNGSVVTVSGTNTGSVALITSGTINNATVGATTPAAGTFTTMYSTQYTRLQYFSKLTRPASGATIGSMISMKSSGTGDCGVTNTGANTTFVVCVSDGSDWKSIS